MKDVFKKYSFLLHILVFACMYICFSTNFISQLLPSTSLLWALLSFLPVLLWGAYFTFGMFVIAKKKKNIQIGLFYIAIGFLILGVGN